MRVTGSGVVHVSNIYLIPPTELENETEAGRHRKLTKASDLVKLSPCFLFTFLTDKSIRPSYGRRGGENWDGRGG